MPAIISVCVGVMPNAVTCQETREKMSIKRKGVKLSAKHREILLKLDDLNLCNVNWSQLKEDLEKQKYKIKTFDNKSFGIPYRREAHVFNKQGKLVACIQPQAYSDAGCFFETRIEFRGTDAITTPSAEKHMRRIMHILFPKQSKESVEKRTRLLTRKAGVRA